VVTFQVSSCLRCWQFNPAHFIECGIIAGMQNENIEDTSPTMNTDVSSGDQLEDTQSHYSEIQHIVREPSDTGGSTEIKKKRSWILWFLVFAALFIVIAVIGAYLGYQTGIAQRIQQEEFQLAVEAVKQFELGVKDLEAKRCIVARQRFEHIVLNLDPNYPEITEKLAQAIQCTDSTATPTVVPTPTVTPTVDLRGAEELFAQALALVDSEDWDTLIEILDALRKNYPAYNTVDVDGMYYLAFRNRGEYRVLVVGDLEGGIFDLNRAEQIGLLDVMGSAYRKLLQ
jgi:hypothetical protein